MTNSIERWPPRVPTDCSLSVPHHFSTKIVGETAPYFKYFVNIYTSSNLWISSVTQQQNYFKSWFPSRMKLYPQVCVWGNLQPPVEECYQGLQTAPSSPERMIGALEVRTPYSSWTSHSREGRRGDRQSTQVPSGDLGPFPHYPDTVSGSAGEKLGVEDSGDERGLSRRPDPFSLLIPGRNFSSLVPSPTFCFLGFFFFNWGQISHSSGRPLLEA